MVLDPAQSQLLVEDADVWGSGVVASGEEAKRSEAIVDADHHHLLLQQPLRPIVLRTAGTKLEGASMDPKHHGVVDVANGFKLRCEDVQEEAILGSCVLSFYKLGASCSWFCGHQRLVGSVEVVLLHRRHESEAIKGGDSIWDPLVGGKLFSF